MLAISRAMLTCGSLIASASLAQAGSGTVGDPKANVPLPVERPFIIDGLPVLTVKVRHQPLARQTQPAEASLAARITPPAKPTNTETAAPTPTTAKVVAESGPRESAAPTLSDLVTRHARDNGVPISLAQAVIRIESRGNPLASNRGALGLMQIKPGTARSVGFSGGAAGLLVADTNLRYGMKVLGQAVRSSGGDLCRALMLYQSGHFATHMTASNRSYCSKARAIMAGA